MNDDFRLIFDLVDRCYEAAVDDQYWPGLLKDIRRFLDGCSITLFCTDAQLRPIDQMINENVPSEAIASYKAYYHRVDVRLQRAIPGALDSIVTDRDLVDDAIVDKHEFYQDFLRPIGHRYVVSAVMDLKDGHYAFCSCHRGLKQDHADGALLEKARLMMPHVRRSLQLRQRLSAVEAKGSAALEVIDGIGQAVFLIDSEGRIIWQNAHADLLLDQQDGLMTSEGELRTLSAAATTELQKLIKAAIAVGDRPGTSPGGMMMVPRPSLRRSYQLLVTPLARVSERCIGGEQIGATPAAAIFIVDLEQKPVPRTEVLRTLYKLTPAEVRLAMSLVSGVSLKAYAERTELSIHYVRWLLKQVEAKTGTRRNTDLIRLLARQTGFFGAMTSGDRESDP